MQFVVVAVRGVASEGMRRRRPAADIPIKMQKISADSCFVALYFFSLYSSLNFYLITAYEYHSNNNNNQVINIEAIQQQQQHQQPQVVQQQQQEQQQQQIPAVLAAYQAMPQIHFMANDQQHDECAICLGSIPLETFVRPLPCNHIFHNDCIENWFRSGHKTCPICRSEMATQSEPDQHNNGTANEPN